MHLANHQLCRYALHAKHIGRAGDKTLDRFLKILLTPSIQVATVVNNGSDLDAGYGLVRSPNNSHEKIERFIAQFTAGLADPTSPYPRIVSKTDLIRLIAQIKRRLNDGGVKLADPAKDLKAVLERVGLVQRVDIDLRQSLRPVPELLLLGTVAPNQPIDPVELLQAVVKKPIVCYFSALVYHQLTTQLASHHHAAQLKKYPPKKTAVGTSINQSVKKQRRPNPLGQHLFQYEGVAYYLTERDEKLVRGVQRRYLEGGRIFQITNLEQTLLDTLQQPLRCGGPAVIFEAWQVGNERLEEEMLAECLLAINDNVLTRRAGLMMRLVGYHPGHAVSHVLSNAQTSVSRENRDTRASLIKGIHYEQFDDEWQLECPA